jgi:hypothetical protein
VGLVEEGKCMVTRWVFIKRLRGVWDIVKTKDGAWVSFEDHEKAAASQRALIEQQAQEIERLKSKVEEWIRRKNHIERAYRGYGTPDEEIAKKAAWMKGQT